MHVDVKQILFDQNTINAKVAELGQRIEADYPSGNLLVIGVLKGASVFMADLIRNIGVDIQMDFISASSYGSSSESSGVVKIDKDLDFPIEGRDILIVEDIIDTGLTLHYLTDILESRNPKSIEICSLVDKPSRRRADIDVKYIGFEVPDEFIVGYGIDYAEKYRNLPYIAVLKDGCITN